MLVVVLIGLLLIVITLGLGYWSYVLGKRNSTNLVGAIIPAVYFIVRALLAVMMQGSTRELITSLIGSLIFSLIYYGLFVWGKHRANKAKA
ncbi:hypothetical protein [Lactiplantibacillus herbarum]|uniref:hypothetical protein n=1 Tax=Lactiplantibacillus herbarum TaxID=1670446 RepID=UPI00064F592B|nr:hypothetical protein [Lactiplantibacillus herbarum]